MAVILITPNNLNQGLNTDTANWPTGRVANLQTGVYWQYLQNPDAFICPVFAATVMGSKNWESYYNKLSTYVMNGASAFYSSDGAKWHLWIQDLQDEPDLESLVHYQLGTYRDLWEWEWLQ